MPDNAAIYSSLSTLLTAADIARLAEGAVCAAWRDAGACTALANSTHSIATVNTSLPNVPPHASFPESTSQLSS